MTEPYPPSCLVECSTGLLAGLITSRARRGLCSGQDAHALAVRDLDV